MTMVADRMPQDLEGTAAVPRALGPDFVALQVADLERSRRFYTEQLGLEVDPSGPPHAVVFRTQPIPFAVREPLVDLSASPQLGWGMSLWLRMAGDADELCARLERSGTRILQRPQDGPFGRFFILADPDGYALTLHAQ